MRIRSPIIFRPLFVAAVFFLTLAVAAPANTPAPSASVPASQPDPARWPALIQRLGNSAFANCRKLFVDDEVQKKPRRKEKT